MKKPTENIQSLMNIGPAMARRLHAFKSEIRISKYETNPNDKKSNDQNNDFGH